MSALPPKADMCSAARHVRFGPKADICGAKSNICFTLEIAHSQALLECPLSAKNRHGEPAERCQLKPLNVGACHDGIGARGGRDAHHMDFVRYSAVRMFPHVCHHRGDRLAYLADPEKRARSLLATLNVLFSCHPR
jgi:hypothetical protein